jgi:hypothetical protein
MSSLQLTPIVARPVETCPLTGLPAKYKDPQSGVPFASVDAYQRLQQVTNHEYAWDERLGCYTSENGGLVQGTANSDVGAL